MARCLKLLLLLLTAFCLLPTNFCSADDRPRIAFITSKHCEPCQRSKAETVPELKRRGFEIIEYDGDRDDVQRLFGVKSLPAWYALDQIPNLQRHGSADEVLDSLCLRPQPQPQAQSPPNTAPVTLAAMVSRYLGQRACLELALPAARNVTLDDVTTIHLPKLTRADVEVTADNVVLITFEKPVPTASTIKLGATLAADLPLITIRQNTITATAELGLGLKKRLVFELKETPWE